MINLSGTLIDNCRTAVILIRTIVTENEVQINSDHVQNGTVVRRKETERGESSVPLYFFAVAVNVESCWQ